MDSLFTRTLRRGAAQFVDHPQLWLTVVVAVAIVLSFAYIADRFIRIARDAQDRVVNVRVGALQDAFAPLAAAFIDDPERLQGYMKDIARNNPTISEFDIVEKVNDSWRIIDSLDREQLGTTLLGQDFFLSLAIADPSNSFTVEEVDGGERFFRTARAITNASSSVIAVALTKQSLSEADRSIAASIQMSVIVLVVILLMLLFLFFHHARIIDYTALYRRLKEVDELKDDFIGMASHELRTPLTVIRGYIGELKEKKIHSGVDTESIVDRIDRSAENLNMLVSDMLDVARIEQGRMPLDMKELNPSDVVREVSESLKNAAAKKSLTIVCELLDNARIMADEARLRQIVTNLISNAIKYSDKGQITVTMTEKNGQLALRVSDTGIGMTAEDLSKLFTKFHRAAGDRVRSEIGTGLGLWITKQLIEAMNGKISVESIHGVGSHFIVTFPVART
jgi:signal transduction histidine kinase